ncbi:MAG: D-aminoacyl-tRNA deacylase [Acidobacteriota bacterium]
MKAVIQRVSRARVLVDGQQVAAIGAGLLVLLGVEHGDGEDQVAYFADKLPRLRIFEDAQRRMNRALVEVGGELLLVSQFTLVGRLEKGRRPSFVDAAAPEEARRLYEMLAERLRQAGVPVQTGRFQEFMQVELTNSGPVTFLLERRP